MSLQPPPRRPHHPNGRRRHMRCFSVQCQGNTCHCDQDLQGFVNPPACPLSVTRLAADGALQRARVPERQTFHHVSDCCRSIRSIRLTLAHVRRVLLHKSHPLYAGHSLVVCHVRFIRQRGHITFCCRRCPCVLPSRKPVIYHSPM